MTRRNYLERSSATAILMAGHHTESTFRRNRHNDSSDSNIHHLDFSPAVKTADIRGDLHSLRSLTFERFPLISLRSRQTDKREREQVAWFDTLIENIDVLVDAFVWIHRSIDGSLAYPDRNEILSDFTIICNGTHFSRHDSGEKAPSTCLVVRIRQNRLDRKLIGDLPRQPEIPIFLSIKHHVARTDRQATQQ